MPPINTTEFLIKFGVEKAGAEKAKDELRKLADTSLSSAQKIDSSFRRIGESITVSTKSTKDGTVEIVKNTQVLENSVGVQQRVTDAVEIHSGAQIKNLEAMRSATTATSGLNSSQKGLIASTANLAVRAALVVPIWQAIRAVFTSTVGTFQDTVKNIVDLDTALAQLKNELGDIPNPDATLKDFRIAAEELSKSLGVSSASIVDSGKKFKSAGLTAEEALAGMRIATQASVAGFEDLNQISDNLIGIYTLMGDKITGASTAQEKFQLIIGKIFSLMPTNIFTLGEFNDALKNFLGTANASGLSLDQLLTSIAVSADAMQTGARGGTRLTSVFSQLSLKTKELRAFIGKPLPVDDFQKLILFFDTVEQKNKAGTLDKGIFGTIFGNRGNQIVKGLIPILAKFREELARTGTVDVGKSQEEIAKRLANSLASIQKASDRLKFSREEFGKGFIEGLFGGDFESSTEAIVALLDDLNFRLKALSPLVKFIGEDFRQLGEDINFIGKLGFKILDFGNGLPDSKLKEMNKQLAIAQERLVKISLSKGFDLKDFSLDSNAIAEQILEARRKVVIAQGKITPQNSVQDTSQKPLEEDLDISKALIDARLDILKSEGALTSELIKQELAFRKQLDIEDKLDDGVNKRIELEKALTQEKRLQSRLGNDSLKLFEIAQKEGVKVAQDLGDVLAGKTDFSSFVRRGGKEVDIFKEQFADAFKQQQAQAFFLGKQVPGESPFLRGGRSIAIQEESLRRPTSIFDTQLELQRQRFQGIESLDPAKERRLNFDVNAPITVNLTLPKGQNIVDIQSLKELAQDVENFEAGKTSKIGSILDKFLKKSLGGVDNQTL